MNVIYLVERKMYSYLKSYVKKKERHVIHQKYNVQDKNIFWHNFALPFPMIWGLFFTALLTAHTENSARS
jgi:hypothetical protein